MLLFLVIRQQLGSDLSTSLKACTKHEFYLTSESHSVLRDHKRPYTLRHLDIVYTLSRYHHRGLIIKRVYILVDTSKMTFGTKTMP